MQSKLLINILALFVLIGLTAFATIRVIAFDKKSARVDNTEVIESIIVKNQKLEQETMLLVKNLRALRENKAFLQGGISENQKSSNELNKDILLLSEKKRLLVTDIKILENKKVTLDAKVSDVLEQSENIQKLILKKGVINNEKAKNLAASLMQISDLQAENGNLKNEILSIRSKFDEKALDNRHILELANVELKKSENRALKNQGILEKEIKELLSQMQVLVIESKRDLELETNEKERLIEQFKVEKTALKIISQNQSEIENLKNLKLNFEKLNGLRVIFSGNMMYDEASSQIVFQADNSIGIPIFQDDFTGSIAGKCGLPIDKEIENRCSATIIAEFVVENSGLFLRGKEIVEIVRK